MSQAVQIDVIELLRAFLSHYPAMRLGQAICGIAGWEVEEPSQASDELLIDLLRRHLEGKFGDQAYVAVNSSISEEMAVALRDIRQEAPSAPLGKVLMDLVCKNNWNVYDVENDDLLVALRAEALVSEFVKVAALAGTTIPASDIKVETLRAPHKPPSSLPKDTFAVYVFLYGERCLKVGKAGPKSTARYCGQHYSLTGAPSTLAKSIYKVHSNFGLNDPNEASVKEWICQNTHRVNFLLPSRYGVFTLALLEAFIQCRLQPEFEGFSSQRLAKEKIQHGIEIKC